MTERPETTEREDTRSPEEIRKAQRTMVFIFGFATLMPALWMVLMASSGIALAKDNPEFATVLVYWGLAAPVVWLASNGMALKHIQDGNGDKAKLFPLIPAFWAIIWFASQVSG